MRMLKVLLAVLTVAAPPAGAILSVAAGGLITACATPSERAETRQETRVEGRTSERQEERRD
ncbi:MAG TPA: hypothetical protein VFY81_12630 [Gammaproteobacteria bacterium]|nr:hypothetical protein [Gammaproteobacteria bacterium]